MLKRTPLYDFHLAGGAKMVEFAGWEMPLLYRGIVEEHQHTRRSGSFFDVSHMGRLYITGPDAQTFLNYVLTRNVADQQVGQSRYALVCNERGGVMDDVIVSRDSRQWLVVCNAANREKLLRHFTAVRQARGFDFDLADHTESTGMVAIQGPRVIDRLAGVLPVDFGELRRWRFETISMFLFVPMSVFRTGYTGEDGVEIIFPAATAAMGVKLLGGSADRADATIKPAGLGARDTLRLEAGLPLYGHELNEDIDPLSAGLAWAVDLSKDFIGSAALRPIHDSGPRRRLVGLELEGRRIARQGTELRNGQQVVGTVTSGTFGPTVGKSIAMAYVDADAAVEGATLHADLKGEPVGARIVRLPFYRRQS